MISIKRVDGDAPRDGSAPCDRSARRDRSERLGWEPPFERRARRGLRAALAFVLPWVLPLVLPVWGCGADGGPPPRGEGEPPPRENQAGVTRELGLAESSAILPNNDPRLAPRLAGRYVIRKRRALIQEVPLLGDTETIAASYGLATIDVEEGTAVLTERYCRSTIESSGAVRTVVPDALPRSMDAIRQPLTVWQDGEKVRWRRPEVVVVSGAQLEAPRSDALPTQSSDPRVFDQDRDGHPGVTVNLHGLVSGSLFLVQRSIDRYEGQVDVDGELSAELHHESASRIIGATSPLLRNQVPQRNDPNPTKSNVLLVRIAGTLDCDALVEALPRLLAE